MKGNLKIKKVRRWEGQKVDMSQSLRPSDFLTLSCSDCFYVPFHARNSNGAQYDTTAKDCPQCRDFVEQYKCKKDAVNRLETGGNACQLCFDVNKTFDEKDMG